ncbi:MAG: DUF1761 domain-containing protein [Balneolaceae bacterium]
MIEIIISLNVWAVLVAAVTYFMLGWIWYGPLFSKKWMALRKLREQDIKDPDPKIFMWSFLLQFTATVTLAVFLQALAIDTALHGSLIGFGAAAGFVFTLAGTTGLFSENKLGLHFIDNGYHVVGLAIAGAILGAW